MQEKTELKKKTNMNLVVIGNVDSGKSTTCGNLLFNLGSVSKRNIEALQKEAEIRKKQSFFYAYVMDSSKDSRDRGITIDISMKQFETLNYNYTLIDAPGHKDFVKNMITGTQQADVAMLMVSAHKGEFESGFTKDGQTKEHALLAFTLGVKRIIVCINKMDQESVKYSEERYKEVKEEVEFFLQKKIGFKQIDIIPISGFQGDNLIKKSENMSWYEGPTLLEILDSIPAPKRPTDKPLRVPVQQTYQIPGIGTVVSGKVEAGILKPGMQVMIYPSGIITKVQSIEAHKQSLSEAYPGDVVGMNLRNVSVKDISKGMVICSANEQPCKPIQEFIAQVIVMNHPKGIKEGYTPTLSCHSSAFACTFEKFLMKLDRRTGKEVGTGETPEYIKNGEAVLVKMKASKEVVLEKFTDCPALGRFVIRDMKQTVAVGIIKSLGPEL